MASPIRTLHNYGRDGRPEGKSPIRRSSSQAQGAGLADLSFPDARGSSPFSKEKPRGLEGRTPNPEKNGGSCAVGLREGGDAAAVPAGVRRRGSSLRSNLAHDAQERFFPLLEVESIAPRLVPCKRVIITMVLAQTREHS